MDNDERAYENRRARLRIWFEDRRIPKARKAQISNLLRAGAGGVFGSNAARSLERFCEMPTGHLDEPITKRDIANSMRELRLYKARILVAEAGGIDAFSRKIGKSKRFSERVAGIGASEKIYLDDAKLIEDAFEKHRGWLSEIPWIELNNKLESKKKFEPPVDASPHLQNVPLGSLIIAIGSSGEVTIEDSAIEGYVPFATRSNRPYAARLRGGGAAPRACSGDIIIVEPDVPAVPGDTIIIFLNNSKKFIKKLLYLRDGETYVSSVLDTNQMAFQSMDILEVHRFAGLIPFGSINFGPTKAGDENKAARVLKTAG